jgi:hypothetical protein
MLLIKKNNIHTSPDDPGRLDKISQKTCYRCGGLMVDTFRSAFLLMRELRIFRSLP